jgi:hypothetical protein
MVVIEQSKRSTSPFLQQDAQPPYNDPERIVLRFSQIHQSKWPRTIFVCFNKCVNVGDLFSTSSLMPKRIISNGCTGVVNSHVGKLRNLALVKMRANNMQLILIDSKSVCQIGHCKPLRTPHDLSLTTVTGGTICSWRFKKMHCCPRSVLNPVEHLPILPFQLARDSRKAALRVSRRPPPTAATSLCVNRDDDMLPCSLAYGASG